jgi:polyisoprenyl-teichoic acid--peptidoglycan teichoic acid transferase
MQHASKPKSPPVSLSPRPKALKRLGLVFVLSGVALLSAAAGALVAAALATTPLLQSQLSPEDANAFEQEDISTGTNLQLPQLTRPVNILVLGVKVLTSDVDEIPPGMEDQGYHALVNSFDGLADTMLLIRFNPVDQQMVVLSLPRDTQIYSPEQGVVRLNSTNYYGGPAATARATSELLDGIAIDRYVRINVQGVERLIDALGGVEVYVPYDMKYQDDSQHLYINLQEGRQKLNGDQALQFLRFRYDQYGDIGRIQRQQLFMRALAEQALNPVTIARLPRILSVVQEHVDTNLSVEELVALVGFGTQVDRSDVQMLMLPGEFGMDNSNYGDWIPHPNRISEMVSQHLGNRARTGYALDPTSLRIAIQDSTGREQAVDALIEALQNAGYSNIYVDQAWNEPLSETQIVAQGGDVASANALQEALGFGEVRVESTGQLESDLTIQLGRDWLKEMP